MEGQADLNFLSKKLQPVLVAGRLLAFDLMSQ